jgi:hypothetical protein
MQTRHDPLVRARLADLLPTQISVGYAEVERKRKVWKALKPKARDELLARHWIPAVKGPANGLYVIDHHHLGLALIEQGVESAWIDVVKDLSFVDRAQFWPVMEFHQWAHPYDARGRRCDFSAIPSRLSKLKDDPYRSLAGDLRTAGGYAKDVTPYSEFLWANFLRERIDPAQLKRNAAKALEQARALARSQQARYLPGWTGIIEPEPAR